jgi:hypothetical protein
LDIPHERLRADIWIYRGLIAGYTAKLAAFVREERLDTLNETSGYCGQFVGDGVKSHYQDILPLRWQYTHNL